jgi:olefin beta-lactone synthetase
MNVCEILSLRAKQWPIRTAIVDRRKRLSYQELETRSAHVAGALLRQGAAAGDAALVMVPLSAEFYITVIALLRIGAVPVLVDPGQGRSHLEHCCRLIRPRIWIGSPLAHLLRAVTHCLRRIPLSFCTAGRLPGSRALFTSTVETAEIEPVPRNAPALITFTSGSTGTPKAIARSHGFLLAQHIALQQSLAHAPGEIVLSALPVFVLSHLAAGLSCVLPACDLRRPEKIAPDPVITQLAACGVTSVEAPPSMLEQIVRRCMEKNMRLVVRRFLVGGAPVFPRLSAQLETISPGCHVTSVYGSSEAEPIAHVNTSVISPADISAMRAGEGLLVGTPVSSICLRILPEGLNTGTITSRAALERASLPCGECGEIAVSGSHVLSGYLQEEGAPSKFRVDGVVWHRTGDVGYLDPRGRLWLVGRAGSCADSRGKLCPLAMETAMSFCPAVARSAFFTRKGQRVLALVLEPGAHALPDLPGLAKLFNKMQVDTMCKVRMIPTDKRHNSKIDYRALGGDSRSTSEIAATSTSVP